MESYFDSYAKKIEGNVLVVASPAKHKFLQRRQYTRIKYIHDLVLSSLDCSAEISTLDISAGGMKFRTNSALNIDKAYNVTLPLSDNVVLNCNFQPIRIEKSSESGYIVSGQFVYNSASDRMVLTQYCSKRSFEIKNK